MAPKLHVDFNVSLLIVTCRCLTADGAQASTYALR